MQDGRGRLGQNERQGQREQGLAKGLRGHGARQELHGRLREVLQRPDERLRQRHRRKLMPSKEKN